MRKTVLVMIALGSLACHGDGDTMTRPCTVSAGCCPPGASCMVRSAHTPMLTTHSTWRPILTPDSLVAMEVSVLVSNQHEVHLQIAVGGDCQLGLDILVEDGGGRPFGPITCEPSGPPIDLGPLDTVTLTRVFDAHTLALVAPGTYGLAPVITQTNARNQAWAGWAQFPLARP
jgi:hypothetical protein